VINMYICVCVYVCIKYKCAFGWNIEEAYDYKYLGFLISGCK
jgi:hypothetical protein